MNETAKMLLIVCPTHWSLLPRRPTSPIQLIKTHSFHHQTSTTHFPLTPLLVTPHPSPIPHLLLSAPVLSSLLTPHLSKHQPSAVHAKSEIPETTSVRNQTAASMSPYQCHRHSNMEKLAAMVAGRVLLGCSCSLAGQGGSQGEGEGRGAGGIPWHPWRRLSSSRTTPIQALVPCAAAALWPPEPPWSTWCGNASLLFTECFDNLNDLLQ